MTAPLPTASAAATTPAVRKWITVAGLMLLTSACAGDAAGPMAAPEPAAPTAASMARTAGTGGPAACTPNSRLIGRILLSTADTPGTWWHLTREGLDAAGVTDYVATMEGWFGREFSSEAEAISFLVAQVEPLDANENGYVCAYSVRGTRTSTGDPDFALTSFGVHDDEHAAK